MWCFILVLKNSHNVILVHNRIMLWKFFETENILLSNSHQLLTTWFSPNVIFQKNHNHINPGTTVLLLIMETKLFQRLVINLTKISSDSWNWYQNFFKHQCLISRKKFLLLPETKNDMALQKIVAHTDWSSVAF